MKRYAATLLSLLILFLTGCMTLQELPEAQEPLDVEEQEIESTPIEDVLEDIDETTDIAEVIEEYVDPDTIVSIVYSGGFTAEAVEPFWEDDTFIYSFPTIRSHLVTVTYADGSTQTICEALTAGKATIEDLDRFDISYFKEERVFILQSVATEECFTTTAEEASVIYSLLQNAEWTAEESSCDPDFVFLNETGAWAYHTDCGAFSNLKGSEVYSLSEQDQDAVNEIVSCYFESIDNHSPLYLPDVDVEDVIRWFNEVTLAAEFELGGDASLVQKWTSPIVCSVTGEPTEEDLILLQEFMDQLNEIEGFPGISIAEDGQYSNISMQFCTEEELLNTLGDQFVNSDGGVVFWYDYNEIYHADICILNSIDQHTRNSVIMEEIYNGLGPVQDTSLRDDSLIWYGYSVPQSLTDVDWLILKLLYHPDIRCGMDAAACEAVIRELYW